MITFKQLRTQLSIFEARKNAEQNPKISAYDALSQYKNNDNAYIHFSDINKVGINPLSDFETPVGIYAYPLREVWDYYEIDKHKSFKHLPFAADRKYIHIIEWNGRGKFVKDFHIDYTTSNLNYDIQKMKTVFENKIDKSKMEHLFDKIESILTKWKVVIPSGMMMLGDPINIGSFLSWSIDKLSSDYPVIIKEVLPIQKEYNYTLMDFDTVIDVATQSAKQKSPAGEFWQITRFLANYGIDPSSKRFYNDLYMVKHDKSYKGTGVSYKNFQRTDNKFITTGSRNWTHLLKTDLGYAGFSDNSGRGIIHKAEPVQTLFLGREYINQLDSILNKDYIDSFAVLEHERDCYDYLDECYKKSKVPFSQEEIQVVDSNYNLAKVAAKMFISNLGSAAVHDVLLEYKEANLDNKGMEFLDNILKDYKIDVTKLKYKG